MEISIVLLAVALIAAAQYATWRETQRFNPAPWLFLPLRRKREHGRSSPPDERG